ncbi:Heterokaryon incompatibility protein 6, OR allele [Colletotrichum fructicola]|nr:Heterokaryon incompatibility protein 6, OR allele [Colletotrichum fructicola]KAF4930060.1 Heterokaryon incompatibility protein 6, OR allele [Colletotrichum fructicola]
MISVEKLTIVTISHDQGFSNTEEADRGTYNSSFTWFEVVVISESNHERSPAKDVQRNVHASRERKRHENVYDVRDDDDTRRWLSTIHGGDTIQLVMRAEFPAWVNYCYKAEIKLVGTAVDSDTIRPSFEASVTSKSPNIYAALNQSSRDIRVLAISPASFNEPIHCSLKIVSLDDDKIQSYDALSYCWGNLPADKFIELDVESLSGEGGEAHQLALSTTLFEALRHLRPQTGYPKLLWVDFICINQSDLVERAAQVGIMPKIYSRAEKVHVWLGSSDVVTQRVMRDVMDVASRYDDGSIEADEGQTEKIKQRHGPVFPGHLEDRMLTFVSDWRSCDFAWFRRTWVLQEVANSKSAVVHCGRDVVPWSVILRLADCFIKAKRITSLFRYSIMPPIFTSLFRLENNVVVDAPRRSGRGILEILVAGHDLEASDPKDKIFALLQFGRETSELERLPSLIRPDYAKSVARVFADFTRWWIMTHKSLRVLSAVHTNKDRAWQQMSSGLPVDLDSLNRPTWCFWHGGASSWAKATLALSETMPYRSSGDSVPDMALLAGDVDEPMHLRLRGLRVCTVESIQLYPMFRRTSTSEMEKAFFRIFDPTGLQKTWIWNREEQTIPPPSNAFEDEDSLNRLGEHYSAHWQFIQTLRSRDEVSLEEVDYGGGYLEQPTAPSFISCPNYCGTSSEKW